MQVRLGGKGDGCNCLWDALHHFLPVLGLCVMISLHTHTFIMMREKPLPCIRILLMGHRAQLSTGTNQHYMLDITEFKLAFSFSCL